MTMSIGDHTTRPPAVLGEPEHYPGNRLDSILTQEEQRNIARSDATFIETYNRNAKHHDPI